MPDVTRLDEVSLFANFYPIVGQVRPYLASQWPQKQVIGDFTKDSEKIVSSWVINDQTGGMGVKEMDESKHANRFFQSSLNTDYPGHLFMPFFPSKAEDDPAAAPSLFVVAYSNREYVVWSNDVVEVWNNTTAAFDAPGGGAHTLAVDPTDAIVHKGKLYFAYGTDFERYTGSAWATGATLSGGAITSRYFVEWDDKLFIVDNTGTLKWSSDEGVTWTTNATSVQPAGSFTSLFLYRNESGALVIYMGTKTGLKLLDYDNSEWVDTELNYPENSNGGKGACQWRGDAYIPVGLTVYKYTVSGQGAVITPMGPGDTDYGLDTTHQGSIVRLLPELNHLYAVVNRSASGKFSQIMRYNGKGWASFVDETYGGGAISDPMGPANIAITDNLYRLWFSFNAAVNYLNMPSDIYNALELALGSYPLQTYNCDHITPWFDARNASINKTALRATVSAVLKQDAATTNRNSIVVAYGIDHADATWTTLATLTKTSDGEGVVVTTTDFGADSIGVAFKTIRFRFRFASGPLAAPEASPDMHWFRLEYLKNIEAQWGFNMLVDCSRDYRHKKAATLVANLKTAAETQTLGAFVYRTFQETSESFNVRVMGMKGATRAGRVREGVYEVNLVAV